MRIRIVGVDLPGRTHCTVDGHVSDQVHVGVQIRREPSDLVRADAHEARWDVEVTHEVDSTGTHDFRGPAVHGRRGDRFLYLTWGDVDSDGAFTMFRRAKLMLGRVDPALVTDAAAGDRPLVATVQLTDDHGAPRCARVDPPAIAWRVG